MDKKEKRQRMLTLALGIALLPPIWAILAPAIGITTCAVALICAADETILRALCATPLLSLLQITLILGPDGTRKSSIDEKGNPL